METSQTLSIESFSYSWLINLKPSIESLDHDSLRSSLDASDEAVAAAFIEMDPKMTPSKRFLRDSFDLNFDFAISQPLSLVHADELFSNGFLMPLFKDPSKIMACNSSKSIPTPPISSEPSTIVLSTGQIHCPFLRKCRRSSKKIFQKYLCFVRPFYRKVRFSRRSSTRAETTDEQVVKSLGNSQQTSPRTSRAYSSTSDWFDIESPIYEAVLHCKKSIGERKEEGTSSGYA
ncbi:hypothetical protein HHK36_027620 [Tetracentron sinense]|uniref:Membrane-associated kinase regulator 6 n=1 Tax=Tetracentron sinense TaxID=13715 RepID=A0A834YDC9_TETSI|nr:hypothetical protein HHK36_027620 [Tetracentron sinense]